MRIAFNALEKHARALFHNEKATLARVLIEERDRSVDADAEQLWIDEEKRRHDAFLKSELVTLPGHQALTGLGNVFNDWLPISPPAEVELTDESI